MSRKKSKHQSIPHRFLQIEWRFIGSDVWLLMTHAKRTVYVGMRREWQRATFGDYGRAFSCPYDFLSCSSRTASKAIQSLIRFNVLKVVKKGGLYKNCTLYRFLFGKWREYRLDVEEQKVLGKIHGDSVARRKANQKRRVTVIRRYSDTLEQV